MPAGKCCTVMMPVMQPHLLQQGRCACAMLLFDVCHFQISWKAWASAKTWSARSAPPGSETPEMLAPAQTRQRRSLWAPLPPAARTDAQPPCNQMLLNTLLGRQGLRKS